MIRRAGYEGEITFECDDCGNELDTGEDDWRIALDMLKGSWWAIRKEGDQWSHYCKGCKRDHPY